MTEKLTEKQKLFAEVRVPQGLHDDSGRSLKACTLCGSNRVRRLYLQAHFPVVRCECGLVFADEHFSNDDLRAFYSGDYYQRAYVCHPKEIDAKVTATYLDEFRRVDRLVPAGGRVLDFGSARGTFVGELARTEMGRRWQVEGIDINPDEVAMGQAQGRPVRVADVFDRASMEVGAFSAVTAFSVLEHMQDPIATLSALRELLKPGGKLLIVVPNGRCLIILLGRLASLILGERARRFSDNVFHEEHLYYFDRETIRRAFEKAGLKTLEIGFHASYIETHPTNPLVALGAGLLRLSSWVSRRQTMLTAVAERQEA